MHSLVEFRGFVEIDNIDVAICGADDEEVVLAVDGVDAVLTVYCCDGVGGSQVPVFDGFVPGACYEDWRCLAGYVDHAHAADGLVVHGYLLLAGTSCAEVEETGGFVCASADYFLAVLTYLSVFA